MNKKVFLEFELCFAHLKRIFSCFLIEKNKFSILQGRRQK